MQKRQKEGEEREKKKKKKKRERDKCQAQNTSREKRGAWRSKEEVLQSDLPVRRCQRNNREFFQQDSSIGSQLEPRWAM